MRRGLGFGEDPRSKVLVFISAKVVWPVRVHNGNKHTLLAQRKEETAASKEEYT